MSDEQGFLQAILDGPDEDGPRLVFADWLEEHGATAADRARAEFIRVQCRLAALDEDDDAWPTLGAREAELLKQHAAAWRRPLPRWTDRESVWFQRGLPSEVTATGPQFARAVKGLVRSTTVSGVALRWADRSLAELAENPALARIRSLRGDTNFHPTHDRAGLRALLGSPHLSGLRTLALNWLHLDEESLRILTSTPHLTALTELSLMGGGLWAATAGRLPSAVFRGSLRVLRLSGNDIRPAAAETLLHFEGLTDMELASNPLGPERVRALAGSARLGSLTTLNLGGTAAGPDGVAAVCDSPHLTGLRRLSLAYNDLGDEGARRLAESGLASLTRLNLCGNLISDVGLRCLADPAVFPLLRVLDLRDNPLSLTAIKDLLAARSGRLRRVDVYFSPGVTDLSPWLRDARLRPTWPENNAPWWVLAEPLGPERRGLRSLPQTGGSVGP